MDLNNDIKIFSEVNNNVFSLETIKALNNVAGGYEKGCHLQQLVSSVKIFYLHTFVLLGL